MRIRAPTDECLTSKTGLVVNARSSIHLGHLSLVERIRFRQSGENRTAVLKTVCPALAHERHIHAAVQGFEICAPVLLGSGDADDDHDAWLLLSDVEDVDFDELSVAEATQALASLAGVHRAYIGRQKLAGVPRRDPSWLVEHSEETADLLRHLVRRQGLGIKEDQVSSYPDRLQMQAGQHGGGQLTLVHGDFDPGNLIRMPLGQFAALDWGLGHLNTPLVDLAHMAERFLKPEQSRLAMEFSAAVGISGRSSDELVEAGLLAHRAFFVWWHSHIVAEGWAPIEDFRQAISQRVGLIAGQVALG